MTKDMEYKETMKNHNKTVHLMKANYEKVHNELRLIVEEQQYDIKKFKQQSSIDDEDEAMEITAARTPKQKE